MDEKVEKLFIEALVNKLVDDARKEKDNESVKNGVLPMELRERYRQITAPRDFEVGDLVVWKDGMRNKKLPHYGQPAIVTAILDEPVHENGENAGSPYFREPLDVRIMLIDSDGDAIEFYLDGRRLRRLTEKEEAELSEI